jgi:hypothetical protein
MSSAMRALRETVGLDKRALAVFRICFGVVIMCDVFHRLLYVREFLSDSGLFTRNMALASEWNTPYVINVWLATGSVFGCSLLLFVTMLCAVCFTLGYRTKVSGWMTWFLMIGLHHRNPTILHSGDVLMRCLLFFGNFLPLADHLSVDLGVHTWIVLQRRKCDAVFQQNEKLSMQTNDVTDTLICSTASVAFQLQMTCMYMFSSILKV